MRRDKMKITTDYLIEKFYAGEPFKFKGHMLRIVHVNFNYMETEAESYIEFECNGSHGIDYTFRRDIK